MRRGNSRHAANLVHLYKKNCQGNSLAELGSITDSQPDLSPRFVVKRKRRAGSQGPCWGEKQNVKEVNKIKYMVKGGSTSLGVTNDSLTVFPVVYCFLEGEHPSVLKNAISVFCRCTTLIQTQKFLSSS